MWRNQDGRNNEHYFNQKITFKSIEPHCVIHFFSGGISRGGDSAENSCPVLLTLHNEK